MHAGMELVEEKVDRATLRVFKFDSQGENRKPIAEQMVVLPKIELSTAEYAKIVGKEHRLSDREINVLIREALLVKIRAQMSPRKNGNGRAVSGY